MNFTKPNRAAIRYTNSQWLREDATATSVGGVAVPKDGQKNASPRLDASGTPVCLLSVPKTSQKPPLPREGAPEVPVGKVAVPKGGFGTKSEPQRP